MDDSDVVIIIASYGTTPPSDPRADVNGDNVVDVLDLAEVGSHFGGPPTAGTVVSESGFPQHHA